jgi:hypothetical protein
VEPLSEREGLPAQRGWRHAEPDSDLCSQWIAAHAILAGGPRSSAQPSDFDRAAADAPVAGYKIYDAMNGLAGFPLGVTAARSSDGTLWFAFGGVLSVGDPKHVSADRRAAPARIAGVTVDDRPMTAAGAGGIPSALPPGTRKIQIDYTALRLAAPRQVRFRYRLDGFDPDWVDAGARRQAYYTNLAPGRYVFRVRANGDSGVWGSPEAQLAFSIQPSFRQTGWFTRSAARPSCSWPGARRTRARGS